jgi:hypothetical protein
MVALAVELACTGQLMPSLEVFCYGLVEQRALGVARVEEVWVWLLLQLGRRQPRCGPHGGAIVALRATEL